MCLASSYNSIEELDMLRIPINLKYRNKNGITNSCGGILSVFLSILILGLVMLFVNPFVQRKFPRVRFENTKEYIPSDRNLKSLDFFTAFDYDLLDTHGQQHEDQSIFWKYFNFDANYFIRDERLVGDYQYPTLPMNIKNCTLNELPGDLSSNPSIFYDYYKLNEAKCIEIKNNYSFGGSETSFNESGIEFTINKNYKITDLDLQQFLGNYSVKIYIYYSDVTTKLNVYDNPIDSFISYYTINLKYDRTTTSLIKMALVNVTTDYSWSFEDSFQVNPGLLHYSSESTSTSRLNNLLASIKISNSKYVYSYNRYYMKLPELLANISGVFNVLYVLILAINNYVKMFNFETSLMNDVFEFNFSFDQVHSIRSKKSNDLELNSTLNQKNITQFPSDKSSNIKNLPSVNELQINSPSKCENNNLALNQFSFSNITNFEQLKKKSYPNTMELCSSSRKGIKIIKDFNSADFFYSWEDSFKFLFCSCCAIRNKIFGKKMVYYRKAIKTLNDYLNIDKIVKKFIELEFLKYNILDNDQLNLINISKLPTISNNYTLNDNTFSNKFFEMTSNSMKKKNQLYQLSEQKLNQIFKSYIKLSNDENNMINKNFIESSKENFYDIYK